VKNKKTVGSKQTEKRGGAERVKERFGEEYFVLFSLFEKNPHGTGVDIFIITDEVPFRVFDIEIMGETLGHGVVNGFIGEEKILLDIGEIESESLPEKKKGQENDDQICCPSLVFHDFHQYHTQTGISIDERRRRLSKQRAVWTNGLIYRKLKNK